MIEELAKYFTGPSVTFHSISLNMDGQSRAAAKAFFETRAALGIGGYDTFEDAVTRGLRAPKQSTN